MPTYAMLFTWTEQGVRAAKDTTKRADRFRAQAEKFKIKIRETLWTVGPYDALALLDAPDDTAASKLAIWMGSQGNVWSLTMRCYTAMEMDKVVEGLG
ncbi:MAG TPA: GYD domain-containing protein [bacterium]|nr:GYD domain-containing protein [bacterium]